jgi:hypothetical protein
MHSLEPSSGAVAPALTSSLRDTAAPADRVEVVVRWGGRVVDVRRVDGDVVDVGCGPEEPWRGQRARLAVPLDGPGFTLLTPEAGQGGGARVHWLRGMAGHVTRGGVTTALAALEAGGTSLVVDDGTAITLQVGHHSIEVRAAPRCPPAPFARFFDAFWANTAVVTLFGATAFLAAVMLVPLGLDDLDDDLMTNPVAYQTLILRPPPKDNALLQRLTPPQPSKGTARKPAAAQASTKTRPAPSPRAAGASDAEVVQSKLAALFGDRGSSGLAHLLGDGDSALTAALGSLDGARVSGAGALDVRGAPGGAADGTLTAGRIHTRGRGSGDVDDGSEGFLIGREDRDIDVVREPPDVAGTLDPEIIRRIVRDHAGAVRYCYERELVRSPSLYGKIVMKWVINAEGKVVSAQASDSQMKNANVESCLSTRIRTWQFPAPRGGGVVVVNYPFIFKPR